MTWTDSLGHEVSAETLLNLVSSVSPVTSENNASKHRKSESTGVET